MSDRCSEKTTQRIPLLVLFVLFITLFPATLLGQKGKFAPTVRTEIGAVWSVDGKVVTDTGKPISGVEVYLFKGAFADVMEVNTESVDAILAMNFS